MARCLGYAGASDPSDAPFTIDLDSTILRDLRCWSKEGKARHGAATTGKHGDYHPDCWPSPPAPETCCMSPAARVDRANTARQDQHEYRHFLTGDGGTGALRRGQRTTHATAPTAGSTLRWRGIRLPQTILM